MGLDMFAHRVSAEDAIGDFEIAKDANGDFKNDKEFHYWRKHHDLHGWMERLYRSKGGLVQSFNCIPVRLTTEDLDKLESDIQNNLLPITQGFFFGDNPPDEESVKYDLEFIEKARQVIADGDVVYYDSWW
jgi:hypothetical protein